MRKFTAVVTAALLVFSGQAAAFGAQIPTDISDTPYESAVTILVQKGILTGNADGTFRPASPINRAEASVIIAKAAEATESTLASTPAKGFSDLSGYVWAESYIDYCASIGAVSGYPGNTFRPGNHVTYAEMAAMLINAMGYSADDLAGTWPDNYMNKAMEIGMFDHIILSGSLDPDAAATRGNVAIMTQVCESDIAIQAQVNTLMTDSAYMRLQNNLLQTAVEMNQLDLSAVSSTTANAAADKLIDAANSLIGATPPVKYQSEHTLYVEAANTYIKAAESLKEIFQIAETGDEATLQQAYEVYTSHLKNAVSIISAI